MRRKTIVFVLTAIAILAAISIAGNVTAGPPVQGPRSQGTTGLQDGVSVQDALDTAFTYQGQLVQNGSPVDGACDFRFWLFDAPSGGTQVSGTETETNVSVTNGLFTVRLDFGEGAFIGDKRWLHTSVRCPAGGGSYTDLSPRQELLAVPYALSLLPGAEMRASVAGDEALHVRNDSSAEGSSGVLGWAYATSGRTIGVWGENRSTAGTGVYGLASAETGATYGVSGVSRSNEGQGVNGYAASETGDTYGVFGEVVSPDGHGVHGTGPVFGVYGEANATSGMTIGTFGVANSSEGYGVHGISLATSGTTRGVSGIVQSADGIAGYFRVQGGAEGLGLRVESPGPLIEAYDGDPVNHRFRVTNIGNVYADGTFNPGGADLAEMLPAASGLEPGDVLVISSNGMLALSRVPNAINVAGVYSTKPGFVGGSDEDGANLGKVPLAVVGVVPVKASAENGAIQPGDLLTSGNIPGHAMKAGPAPAIGTVIGKALERLSKGTGVIQVLVMLQ